jgi:GNAT superfamily N-acetyltransferase
VTQPAHCAATGLGSILAGMSQVSGPPLPGRYDVRRARPEEATDLAGTLAEAFHEDPLVGWVFPDESRRLAVHRRAFDLYLSRVWLRHEETYTVGDGAGVCVWMPPEAWELSAREQLALLPPMLRIYGRRLPRLLAAANAFEKDHPEEPHYYLAFVGVAPASQGQGMGSILMHPVLQRCDAAAIPAYLEASSPRNRALYERHGFAVTEEVRPGRGGPPAWRMWRDPR